MVRATVIGLYSSPKVYDLEEENADLAARILYHLDHRGFPGVVLRVEIEPIGDTGDL
jgi:hypothetical protein